MIVLITDQEAREAVQAVEQIAECTDELLFEMFGSDDSVLLLEPDCGLDRGVMI